MDPVGTIIVWTATYGAISVIVLTFLERVFPFLPSYPLLVLIGMASTQGHFSLSAAISSSIAGSCLGILIIYCFGMVLGERRFVKLLERLAGLFGLSSTRFAHWLEQFRANELAITLGAQLVPTVRIIAPGISGLLRTNFWRFLSMTSLGAALWNAIFISIGYAAANGAGEANASILALKTLAAILTVEGFLVLVWRVRGSRAAR